MKEGDELTKEGEPASAAAAEVNNAEVARVNDDKERKRKQMDSKAFAAVKSFEDRLHEKLLTGAPNTNTNINADMASDDALCSSGLKEEAPEKDEHVHEVVEGEDDLSDQPKGTTPASGDVISSSSAAVIRNDEGEMITANFTTINEDSIPIQPGVMFVPEPDSRGGMHTRGGIHTGYYHSAHEDSDADDDINVDIENQTQTTQTLIEAYTVPDDDEQADIINHLHERLGSAIQKLEQTQKKWSLNEHGLNWMESMLLS
jgi:hypothetical protein